jgi:hypothetical protein
MSNNYKELIGESYKNYLTMTEPTFMGKNISLPEFIHWVKRDDEYSQKWGVKIEKRELSLQERNKWSWDNWSITCDIESVLDEQEVPTKEIKVTYNGKTEIGYE